jgi:hypothetical protein
MSVNKKVTVPDGNSATQIHLPPVRPALAK